METIQLNETLSDESIAQVDVPTLTGPQAQGDLIILPWDESVSADQRHAAIIQAQPIPVGGTVVLTGNGGHDHRLACTPGVSWYAYTESQTLGVLTVADDALAVLGHVEHGDTHIGPGVYVIRRQREQADEIRMVAD